MTEPAVWVPSASGTMPSATAAAEPLDEPPGVCAVSCGLAVRPGAKFLAAHDAAMTVLAHGLADMGLLPVSAPIEAVNLAEAIEKFPEAINQAVEKLIEEAREIQRQEASRIVLPGQDPMGPKIHL